MKMPLPLNSALSDIAGAVRREALRSIEKHGDQAHLPSGTGPTTYPLETYPGLPHMYGDSTYVPGLRHTTHAMHLAHLATLDTKAHSANEGGDGTLTWWLILREEVMEAAAESDPLALRAELIQVAAVAIKWAEAIDRQGAAYRATQAGL